MGKVLIYTIERCPFCRNAKRLLDGKNVKYEEIDVTDPEKKRRAKEKYGWPTVPIILIDGKLIGGYDELRKLEWDKEIG